MLLVVIGCSCSGKNSIMEYLNKKFNFSILYNVSTRLSRIGEYNKITLSEIDFESLLIQKELLFANKFFNNYYAYLKKDITSATINIDDYYMMDFGIENISQLDSLNNTYKIILVPEDKGFLEHTVKKSGRKDRLEKILINYEELYSHLIEGLYLEKKTIIVKNRINQLDKTCQILTGFLREAMDSSLTLKSKLDVVFKNMEEHEKFTTGIEAYISINELIKRIENNYLSISYKKLFPDKILQFKKSSELVSGYSGISIFICGNYKLLISRFGAIEMQHSKKGFNEKTCLIPKKQRYNVIFKKNDYQNEGVWNKKNI